MDVRPSRTSSIERNKEKENSLSYSSDSENKRNSVKESDENKENMIMNSELKEDSVFYQDEEVLNDSIISGKESHLFYYKIHCHSLTKRGSMQRKILSSINSSIVTATFSRTPGENLKLDLSPSDCAHVCLGRYCLLR